MPLIPVQRVRRPKQVVSIRVSHDILDKLELYSEFIHSGKQHVIEHSLALTFAQDADFQRWLAGRNGPQKKGQAAR